MSDIGQWDASCSESESYWDPSSYWYHKLRSTRTMEGSTPFGKRISIEFNGYSSLILFSDITYSIVRIFKAPCHSNVVNWSGFDISILISSIAYVQYQFVLALQTILVHSWRFQLEVPIGGSSWRFPLQCKVCEQSMPQKLRHWSLLLPLSEQFELETSPHLIIVSDT